MGKVIRFKQAEPNFDMAKRFLDMLDPTGAFTFQTFDDNVERKAQRKKTKTRDPLARTFHGTLEEHWDALHKLNGKGAGVYVTISLTDLEGRKLENIVEPRAVFVDYDDRGPDPLDEVLAYDPPPTMVVNTSPSKWHAYWVVEEMPTQDFSRFQKGLAEKFGTDDNVADVSRVMRIPGTLHCKSDVPTLVTLSYMDDEAVYTYDDLKTKFHFKRERTRKTAVAEKQFQASREEVEALLQRMIEEPQEDFATRDPWLKIGMALKNWDEDEGLELWLWFCEQACGDAFDEEECVDKWENDFKRSANARTLATYCQSYEYSIATHTRDEPEDDFAHIPKVEKEEAEDWRSELNRRSRMTADISEKGANQRYVVKGFIPEGMISYVVGRGGTGKTAIAMFCCREMVESGFEVRYIHADAVAQGYHYGHEVQEHLGSQMNYHVTGLTGREDPIYPEDILKMMKGMASEQDDLSKVVFVVDVLGNFVSNMFDGVEVKRVLKLFRKLADLGATVILLGHTNKSNDPITGKPVFQGISEMMNLTDNTIYLVRTNKSQDDIEVGDDEAGDDAIDDDEHRSSVRKYYVSIDPDEGKFRANIQPHTWIVKGARAWKSATYIPVHDVNKSASGQVNVQDEVAKAIMVVLKKFDRQFPGVGMSQKAIVAACNSTHGFGMKKVRSVLKEGVDQYWTVKKGFGAEKLVYQAMDSVILSSGPIIKVEDQDEE